MNKHCNCLVLEVLQNIEKLISIFYILYPNTIRRILQERKFKFNIHKFVLYRLAHAHFYTYFNTIWFLIYIFICTSYLCSDRLNFNRKTTRKCKSKLIYISCFFSGFCQQSESTATSSNGRHLNDFIDTLTAPTLKPEGAKVVRAASNAKLTIITPSSVVAVSTAQPFTSTASTTYTVSKTIKKILFILFTRNVLPDF